MIFLQGGVSLSVYLLLSEYFDAVVMLALGVLILFWYQWNCRKKEDLALGIQEVGFEPPLSKPVMETDNFFSVHYRNCEKSTQTPPAGHKSLSDFVFLKKIYEGEGRQVLKVKHKMDNKEYAMKSLLLQKNDKGPFEEVRALASLEHENVVRYNTAWCGEHEMNCSSSDKKGAKKVKASVDLEDDNIGSFHTAREPVGSIGEGQTENNVPISDIMKDGWNASEQVRSERCLYILMEYCEMSLRDWIQELHVDPTRRERSLQIFRQIIDGLCYIHSKKYIHRDLKPENIFLTKDMTVKIGDFGLTVKLEERKRTRAGTLRYMAPEQKSKCYGNEVDIFPLGLMLFELLWKSGLKYCEEEWDEIRAGDLPAEFEASFPVETREIKGMLSPDPTRRPSAADVRKVFLFTGKRNKESSSNRIRKRNHSI